MGYTLDELDKLLGEPTEEINTKTRPGAEFFGNLLWGGTESAAFGVPDIMASTTEAGKGFREIASGGQYAPWQEQTGAGKVGYIIGSGVGMLVPLTGWGRAASLAFKGLKGLTGMGKAARTAKVGSQLTSRYAEMKKVGDMTRVVQNLGGESLETLVKESDEILGFMKLTPFASRRFQQIGKGSAKAYDDALEGISKSIGQQLPNLTAQQNVQLSQEFLQIMLKSDPGNIHKAFGNVFKKWGIQGRKGEMAAAFASNAMTGMIYHAGNEALQNAAFAVADSDVMKANAPYYSVTDQVGADEHHSLWKNKTFLKGIGETVKHGIGFGLLAPAHYIRGGKKAGFLKEGMHGFNNMRKAWTRVGKLTDKQAIARVKQIEDTMLMHGDMSLRSMEGISFKGMNKTNWTEYLTGNQARKLLKESRTAFSKEWIPYILGEAGKDMAFSTPRMLAGAALMQLPTMAEGYMQGARGWQELFGDPEEFAANMAIGMAFSKKGRVFGEGRKLGWGGESIWQTTPKREAYNANFKRAKAMNRALEYLGMPAPVPFTSEGNPTSILRSSMEDVSEWRHVKEVVEPYYVNDAEVMKGDRKNAKPIAEAYREGIKQRDGKDMTVEQEVDLYNAIRMLEAFDGLGVQADRMFRDLNPSEAVEIVESMKKMPEVGAYRNNIDLWIKNVQAKTNNQAAQRYIEPVNAYIAQVLETLNLSYQIDPITNKITMPEVNLNQILNAMPSSSKMKADLTKAVDAFNDQVGWGLEEGQVEFTGKKSTPALNQLQQESVLQSFMQSTEILNQRTFGHDIMTDPLGAPDLNILTDKTMRLMYRDAKTKEQQNNFLESMEPPGREDGTHSTMNENLQIRVRKIFQDIGIDRPIDYFTEAGQNADTQAEVINTFEKLQELFQLTSGDSKNRKRQPLALSDINAGLNDLFGPADKNGYRSGGVFGDVLSNPEVHSNLKGLIVDKFIDRLGISDASSKYSTSQSLAYLINGSVSAKSSEAGTNVVEPGGKFAKIRANGTMDLPASLALFQSLEAKVDNPADLAKLREFYEQFETNLKGTGGIVRFTNNADNLASMFKTYGTEGIIQLLSNAKIHSDIGKMNDMLSDPGRVGRVKEGLEDVYDGLTTMVDQTISADLMPQLKGVIHNLSRVGNLFDIARREGNATQLLALQGLENNYNKILENGEKFIAIDPTKEGVVNTEYKQQLMKLSMDALELANKEFGEINSDNFKTWVEDQIEQHSRILPDKAHNMEVTITPQRFQQKYGLLDHTMNDILEGAYESYHSRDGSTADVVIIKEAYNSLKDAASHSATSLQLPYNAADLTTDTIQMISARLFRKRSKKLSIKDGLLELTDSFILPDKERGLDGLNNFLRLDGDWYELNKDIKTTDNRTGRIRTEQGLGEHEATIDAKLNNGDMGIENIRQEMDYINEIKGTDPKLTPARSLVRVAFGEVSGLYPLHETRTKIQESFSEGGAAYERLKQILPNGDPRLVEYNKKYTGNMTPEQVADAVNFTWEILNMPHNVKENSIPEAESLDYIKQRKIAHFDRGKMLTQDYYDLLIHAYGDGAEISPIFAKMRDLLVERGGADGRIDNKKQKFVSISDDAGTLTLKSLATRVFDRYVSEGKMTEAERTDALADISESLSAVDSPTFLAKNDFLLELAKLGARPEWFTIENGEITGIKTGAVKPKGVHVSVGENGALTVVYNKTAMFYDPTIGKVLENAGLSGVMFKSGNKINKQSSSSEVDVVDRYTEPSVFEGESLADIISERIQSSPGNVIKLPYDTHVGMNLSKEHPGTIGANSGIHFPHSVGMDAWMRVDQNISDFKDLLISAKGSDYAAASIINQLITKGREAGDSQYSKVPLEVMLEESGLVLQPHLRDLALDKLFSYFFSGGKVAMQTVPNSSYNVMMPDIHTGVSNMLLPVRSGGTQRLLGGYVGADIDFSTPFKKFGFKTVDNSIQQVGSTFSKLIDLPNGLKGDAVIIPDGKDVGVMIDGYFLSKDGVIDMAKNRTGADYIDALRGVAPAILKELGGTYNDILKDIKNNATYGEVADDLAVNHPEYSMINAEVRQPRNSMNDFLLTKITGKHSKEQGNAGSVNALDLALTQDADVDFDKSNSYMSAPADVYKHAMANGGNTVSTDSYKWAESLVEKLSVDVANPNRGSAYLKRWLSVHNNAEAARGQFVKLHNISSYLLNAFPDNGVIGEFKDIGNKKHTLRVKSNTPYVDVVDQISHWVKMYIDSYKKPMTTRDLGNIIDNLILGSGEKIPGTQKFKFTGLFEVVDLKNPDNPKVISGALENPDVRRIVKDRFITPLKRYLRYNRGVSPEKDTGGFTLGDAVNGWTSLMMDIGEFGKVRDVWIGSQYKTSGFTQDIDISQGMHRLRDYIVRESQNPYDKAMRNLYELNVEAENGNVKDRVSKIHGLLENAELDLLKASEPGVEASMTEILKSTSNKMWDFVQRDNSYLQLIHAQRRLSSLKNERDYQQAERFDENPKAAKDRADKITFYEEIVSDMEARIGGEMARAEGRPVFQIRETMKAGTLYAPSTQPLVIWDAKGKIIETIQPGKTNVADLYKGYSAIQNGRRFELADPKRQQYLKARNLAFNDVPIMVDENGGLRTLDFGESQIVSKARDILRDKLAIHKKDLADKKITPAQYVTFIQGELHKVLNGQYDAGINTPMLRKGLIWKLIAPREQYEVATFHKGLDGQYIYDRKFIENTSEVKAVEGYLTGVAAETKFTKGDFLKGEEAHGLLSEIAKRQGLALLGLSKPEANVLMDLGYTGSDWYKNQNRKDITINTDVYKSETSNSEALEILNDFIGKGKLINPFDMKRLLTVIESGVAPRDILQEVQGVTHKRHFGNFGKAPVNSESINEGMRRLAKEQREGCK